MPVVELIYLQCFVLAVALALGMVLMRNPVNQALCLIGVMVSIAAIFVVMHQFFIAAIQIIVYVGAVMALFLWVIMMLNLKEAEKLPRFLMGVRGWGALFGVMLFALIGAGIALTAFGIGRVELVAAPEVALTDIAKGILIRYLLPVELTSILLLVGMIGAVVLSRPLAARREK